jgi:hypothetical protein
MRQLTMAKRRFGSLTAAPVAGARGSYDSDNGHEGGRLGAAIARRAFLIPVNIGKLPNVPRQISKDIPRPPNSASLDDSARKLLTDYLRMNGRNDRWG